MGQDLQHGLVAEGVVGHDDVVGNPEEAEDEGGQDAGAVLAHAAVEHGRLAGRVGQQMEGGRDRLGALRQHGQITLGDEGGPVPVRRLLLPGQSVGERKMVIGHAVDPLGEAALGVGLENRAQVDDGDDAQCGQKGQIVLGQAAQAVGPEEPSPAGAPPVGRSVPAQVTEIEAAVEGQGTGRFGIGDRDGHGAQDSQCATSCGKRRRTSFPRSDLA